MIKRITLKKQAYEYLLGEIKAERIQPSQVYSEQYFADLLEISRTPVREAVLQLNQEGFLQIHPNKGFSVKPASDRDVMDMFRLRSAIEGYCAMYAAGKCNTSEGRRLVKKLRQINEVEKEFYKNGENPELCMETDTKFHLALVEFSANKQMIEIMHNLRAKINIAGTKNLYKEGRIKEVLVEHEKIVEAISFGDKTGAFKAVDKHLTDCVDFVIDDRR